MSWGSQIPPPPSGNPRGYSALQQPIWQPWHAQEGQGSRKEAWKEIWVGLPIFVCCPPHPFTPPARLAGGLVFHCRDGKNIGPHPGLCGWSLRREWGQNRAGA